MRVGGVVMMKIGGSSIQNFDRGFLETMSSIHGTRSWLSSYTAIVDEKNLSDETETEIL